MKRIRIRRPVAMVVCVVLTGASLALGLPWLGTLGRVVVSVVAGPSLVEVPMDEDAGLGPPAAGEAGPRDGLRAPVAGVPDRPPVTERTPGETAGVGP